MIVRTIKEVFPTCRIFRESPTDKEAVAKGGSDFTNMVIFCKKTAGDIAFRRPTPQDYLRSRTREVFLEPRHEVQEAEILAGEDAGILRRNTTEKVAEWHKESAAGHWAIMRMVLPARIWEMW